MTYEQSEYRWGGGGGMLMEGEFDTRDCVSLLEVSAILRPVAKCPDSRFTFAKCPFVVAATHFVVFKNRGVCCRG